MSRANMEEFDFFAMEKTRSRAMDQGTSGRAAKLSAISRMNPQLLRRVIFSGADGAPAPPSLPLLDPCCSRPVAKTESDSSTAPLTIFYNGTVAVFDLAQDKAEAIMKLAEEGNTGYSGGRGLLAKLNGELLPIARKKSLQQFLEKRKQRLTATCPYKSEQEVGWAKKTA